MKYQKLFKRIIYKIPLVGEYMRFRRTLQNRVLFSKWLKFKLHINPNIYWPVHPNSEVTHPQNIYVGINSNPGTRPGCYIQGNVGIWIGNYVSFASNIGVISANHSLSDHTKHSGKKVIIRDYCWIGMNSVILPGVILGERTVVGAGSVVTKSFPEGYCVIAGNPAKVIKKLDSDKFIPTKYPEEFYGFIPKEKFPKFALKYNIPIIY